MTESPGGGVLCIDFRHPTSGIRRFYEVTSVTLLVDGEPVDTQGWAPHRIPLPAGEHEVQVRVVLGSQDQIGVAGRRVTIVDGTETHLVYSAPRSPVSPGSILGEGEEERVEISWLMVGCLVVAVAVVVAMTLLALFR